MDLNQFLDSGILEMYVMGTASEEEREEVERMAGRYEEVRNELEEIGMVLGSYAIANTEKPHPSVKYLLMATIDYMERLKRGEQPGFPPILSERSTLSDFRSWLDRKDLDAPPDFEDIFVRLIGHTAQATTALVWIRKRAEAEVHDDEHERFLILEGTCVITVGAKEYQLVPGDYFAIPLHEPHTVEVTSARPCKVLLQRVAA
jgi:mannose-6-phosphate isomerase-like protein (cupin superfamily)